MARNLSFVFNGTEYAAKPVKVDRSKLYGWTELKALDDEGRECRIVNMDEMGSLVLPKGGLGMGILSPEGDWVERSSLKAIKADGSEAELVPSSFSAPIDLNQKVDTETFLDHKITAVYQLDEAPQELIDKVGEDIYFFTYSFRDSFKGESAFILAAAEALFMLVGQKLDFQMIGLNQAETIDEENADEEDEDSADLDFSMM